MTQAQPTAPGITLKDSGRRDVVIIAICIVFLYLVSGHFDLSEKWFDWVHEHEEWEVDEIPIGLSLLSFGLAIYAFRRWRESRTLTRQLVEAYGAETRARAQAETSFKELKIAQVTIIQSEKMAALGGLVAGVAHEVNTPVGIALTASTQLRKETQGLQQLYDTEKLTAEDLQEFLGTAEEASRIMEDNCARAAKLIQSFKNVAVDQSGDKYRQFMLDEYLRDVLTSLRPVLKTTPHTVEIDCPADIEINGRPGALAQCVTNLIMNSIEHGYPEGTAGRLSITVQPIDGERVELRYCDDGKGISDIHLKKVFEPFYTTRRAQGGSGLGLSIVHNIVVGAMNGSISCASQEGRGVEFKLVFPRNETPKQEIIERMAS